MSAPVAVPSAALFRVGLDQHMTVVGATGTGKTHGAMLLMRGQQKPFIIFDSKASETVAKFADRIITDPADMDRIGKYPHQPFEKVAFRPSWNSSEDELRDLANKTALFVYRRGDMGLLIDEVSDVSRNAQDVPSYVRGLSVRGRERRSTLWACTQRPAGVPLILMSEASHFLVYNLRTASDRDRMATATEHPIQSRISRLSDRQFLYVNSKAGQVTGPYTFT